MADLSKISDDDLMAIYKGNMSSVSDDALMAVYNADKMPEKKQEKETSVGDYLKETALGALEGYEQVITIGLGDELKAALATAATEAAGAVNENWSSPLSIGDQYDILLDQIRKEGAKRREAAPTASLLGELGGGIATGVAAGGKLAGTKIGELALKNPKIAAMLTGAASGGVYGFGTGEESVENRISQAGTGAALGGALGGAGAMAIEKAAPYAGKLAQRAKKLFKGESVDNLGDDLETLVEAQRTATNAPVAGVSGEAGQTRAMNKVIERLKEDYPDNWKQVLDAWRSSDKPLAELAQGRLQNLAKGASAYPRGEAVARKYFDEAISGSPERAAKGLPTDFHGGVEGIVKAGRKKAGPMYQQAYADIVDIGEGLKPEVKQAIKAAKRQFPSELKGLEDNSVKVLDYAKRVLDDQIGAAKRSGENNLARSRVEIKNELVNMMDEASPSYKAAREIAGDYLTTEKSMMEGLNIFKPNMDSEIVGKTLSGLSASEKTAYKEGVKKAIRTQLERVSEGVNPYKAVMGSPEKKKRLMKVFSPKEYKTLETTMKAEDRLFKMRNDVIGGSPTTSKALAAADIGIGGEGIVNAVAMGPRGAAMSYVDTLIRRAFSGMNDKTAEHVSRLIFEKDPTKKLMLIDRMSKGKVKFTPKERGQVKKAYFALNDFLKARMAGAVAGGEIPTIAIRGVDAANYEGE